MIKKSIQTEAIQVYGNRDDMSFVKCCKCGRTVSIIDVKTVTDSDGRIKYVCTECQDEWR